MIDECVREERLRKERKRKEEAASTQWWREHRGCYGFLDIDVQNYAQVATLRLGWCLLNPKSPNVNEWQWHGFVWIVWWVFDQIIPCGIGWKESRNDKWRWQQGRKIWIFRKFSRKNCSIDVYCSSFAIESPKYGLKETLFEWVRKTITYNRQHTKEELWGN